MDYDKGSHRVSAQVSGLRKSDLPKRYHYRVEIDWFQKDWTISEAVEKVMALDRGDNVVGLLNRWAGRFARKNYPVHIRNLKDVRDEQA